MSNTFDWVEIRTGNIKKAAKFYENLFGWKIIQKETAEESDVWIFDTSGKPRVENLRRGRIWRYNRDRHLFISLWKDLKEV